MSLKNKIRSAKDIEHQLIDVPEWDVTIEIRSMTVRQRAAFLAANQDNSEDGPKRIEAVYGQILVTCCIDPETGDPVFDEDDLAWLMTEKSGSVIDKLVTQCLEASGLKEKAVDEAGKSSSGSPTDTGEPTANDAPTSN